MNRYSYLLMIAIAAVVTVFIVKWVPINFAGSTDDGYETWLYIDEFADGLWIVDIRGEKLPSDKPILTYKGDKLIFANRSEKMATVEFDKDEPLGASNKKLEILPGKRKVVEVVGKPDAYDFTVAPYSGPVTPPKVRVGEEP
jgi:hypothetical protein